MWFLIKQGLKGFKHSKISLFLNIGMLTILLYTIGISIILGYNLLYVVKNVQNQFVIKIYLDPTLQEKEIQELIGILKKDEMIYSVTYISPEEGIKQLSAFLNTDLEGILDENPLPPVLNCTINELYLSPSFVEKFISRWKKDKRILDIDFPEKKLKIFEQRGLPMVLGIFIFMMMMFIFSVMLVNYTIRNSILAREKEILLTRLLGGTHFYIRFPLFVEGAIVGTLASGVVILMLIATRYIFDIIDISFIPFWNELYVFILAVGLLIGTLGSQLAVKQYLYADEEML